MDYIIADLHFEDKNIIKYENLPFKDTKEMSEVLINNWNSAVNNEDTVFLLGDFYIGTSSCLPEDIIDSLNGNIILISGNHDTEEIKNLLTVKGHTVYNFPIIYKNFFILSHEPMYVSENSPYANIYGHIHNNPSYKTVSSRSYCVCADRLNFTPVLIDKIIEAIQIEDAKEVKKNV